MNDLAGFEISAQDFVKALHKYIAEMKPVSLDARTAQPATERRSATSKPDPQPAEAGQRASRETKPTQGSLW